MARRVFFSFEYGHDVSRAMVVRNSWVTQGKEAAGFEDAAAFEEVKKGGDAAIKAWIDQQLKGTSVTAVLVGSHTCQSEYVAYEIEQSASRGNGLLAVDISQIRDWNRASSWCCGNPLNGKPLYNWVYDNGYASLGDWIEAAAKEAGR